MRFFALIILLAGSLGAAGNATSESMLKAPDDDASSAWSFEPLLTIGDDIDGYVPPGIPDGMGALEGEDAGFLEDFALPGAVGRLDAYWATSLKIWDLAAGIHFADCEVQVVCKRRVQLSGQKMADARQMVRQRLRYFALRRPAVNYAGCGLCLKGNRKQNHGN